jgi:nucleotide-binding universal stress UspA family protein
MIQINRILCPLDFSLASERAFRHATALARWYGATITALHVRASAPPAALKPWRLVRELGRRVRGARDEGVRVRVAVVDGEVETEILRRAREEQTDLLVLGRSATRALEHRAPGSVTESLERRAPCPVWTVAASVMPRVSPAELRTILCAVDFTEVSLCALEYGLSLAQERHARIVLLHVLADCAGPALARLHALIPAGADEWCMPAARIAVGRPDREILRAAREEDADLVVVGGRRKGELELALFGSTIERVARGAVPPVLVVPARARADATARPFLERRVEQRSAG